MIMVPMKSRFEPVFVGLSPNSKMTNELLQKYERLSINLISWGLFLLCSVGLCGLSYECIKKYLEYPQGIELSYLPQHKIEFPAFNFCPVGLFDFPSNPQPLKEEVVKECGLKMEDMKSHFIGKDSKNCKDPKIFWERVSLSLEDLGIKSISIDYNDGTIVNVSVTNENNAWTKMHSPSFGTCFTLSLPRDLTSKDILGIEMKLEIDKSLYFILFQDTTLNVLNPWITKEFIAALMTGNKSSGRIVSYDQVKTLDTKDTPCESDSKYILSKCIMENLKKVISKNI